MTNNTDSTIDAARKLADTILEIAKSDRSDEEKRSAIGWRLSAYAFETSYEVDEWWRAQIARVCTSVPTTRPPDPAGPMSGKGFLRWLGGLLQREKVS